IRYGIMSRPPKTVSQRELYERRRRRERLTRPVVSSITGYRGARRPRATIPFKSKAQRRKFYAMAQRGEIPWETVHEWERKTGNRKLPERVNKRKGGK